MIISFSVQNFRSVKEEQTLSFEAAKNKDYEEYMVINAGKYRLLKMIALFGNNASGKTNILIAMTCLRELAINTRERGVSHPAARKTTAVATTGRPPQAVYTKNLF